MYGGAPPAGAYDQYPGAPPPGAYDQYPGAPPPGYDPSMGPPPPGMMAGPPPAGFDPSMGPPPPGMMSGPPPAGFDSSMGPPPPGMMATMGGPPPGAFDPSMGAPPPGMMGGPPLGGFDPYTGAPPGYFDPPTGYAGGPPPGAMGGPPMMEPPPMMGGPPMMMLDPAHAQAEDELAKLEEKKRQQEEKEKKKEVEQLARGIRTGARNQEDAASCANLLAGWGILNGLLWAVPLLGDSWWTKMWHGLGIDKMSLTVGLFNLVINVDCKSNTLGENSLCYAMKPYSDHNNGAWAVLELRDQMCREVKEACDVMDRMYYAAFSPLCLFPAAAGFEVLALLLLYFYWHGKPTPLVRSLANKCGAMAPIIGALGFVGWMILSPYMTELPRYWAAAHNHKDFANSAAFGLKETFVVPAGWCVLVAFFNMVSSSIRCFVQMTLPNHQHEPDPYGFPNENEVLLQEVTKSYGA